MREHLVHTIWLALILCLASPAVDCERAPKSCHEALICLRLKRYLQSPKPLYLAMEGTQMPIARALEKEGLFYSDIAPWFDRVEKSPYPLADGKLAPGAARRLQERLLAELQQGPKGLLLQWLQRYPDKYRPKGTAMTRTAWEGLSPQEQLAWLLEPENPFERINVRGRERLFWDELLSYDDLRPSQEAPPFLEVGNDEGSYEVKSRRGEPDRNKYFEQRRIVEEFLDGVIGHQHLVHEWPKDRTIRERIGPQYIELLDALSWYFFWRQMYRNPEEVDSILSHKYFGVYTNASLERLYQAFLDNDPTRFRDKYRMIGARNVPAQPDVEGQKGKGRLPDWEMRSGRVRAKKTASGMRALSRREWVEDLIEARLWSGDYSGLKDFRQGREHFDPSAPIGQITLRWLDRREIDTLERFEKAFPLMRYSDHPLARNHTRNKILAPLLDWVARIPMGYKADILARAQKRYAESLVDIASEYLKEAERVRGPPELTELREEALAELEENIYRFASRVWLDEDFERYLTPQPARLPKLQVPCTGPIDVNAIEMGIEYTFRFPDSPRSRETAERELYRTARAFQRAMALKNAEKWQGEEGTIDQLKTEGHGHNLSIRFQYTTPEGEVWRIEWDGIRRDYVDGHPVHPRAGHIEIPSPKKVIEDTQELVTLYRAMRRMGRFARRSAGGAHLNLDLSPLFDLGPKAGPRKAANLIALFESHRPMFQFLWQHPFRTRAAIPFQLTERFTQRLNRFGGTWDDLGRLLYEERYFNPYLTRKPAYTQLNVTALMAGIVPKEYQGTLDIKNPALEWFPAFGGKGKDKFEWRLFDAPPDELLAALQVVYVRAFLNKAFNTEGIVPLTPVYPEGAMEQWKQDPKRFIQDAEAHLRWLGLSPKAFTFGMVDALRVQYAEPSSKEPLEEYEDFLPLKNRRQR